MSPRARRPTIDGTDFEPSQTLPKRGCRFREMCREEKRSAGAHAHTHIKEEKRARRVSLGTHTPTPGQLTWLRGLGSRSSSSGKVSCRARAGTAQTCRSSRPRLRPRAPCAQTSVGAHARVCVCVSSVNKPQSFSFRFCADEANPRHVWRLGREDEKVTLSWTQSTWGSAVMLNRLLAGSGGFPHAAQSYFAGNFSAAVKLGQSTTTKPKRVQVQFSRAFSR